jgi:hypothetical protein
VNYQHFAALVWLRCRLFRNQLRRGGIASFVILVVLGVAALACALGLFVGLFLVGLFVLPKASPTTLMYVWDALVVVFLFCWILGLLVELQRSEALTMDKFLHLPVSLQGVFLINYLSSLVSFTMLFFLPAALALSLALVIAKGPAMLVLFPLLAGFVLMVTALTHQFQGWLAALMVNQRRRRTVILIVTTVFVLLCQAPNLINLMRIRQEPRQDTFLVHLQEEQSRLQRQWAAGQITPAEYQRRLAELDQQLKAHAQETSNQTAEVGGIAWLLNLVLPPGWLPLGAREAVEGKIWPGLLGTLGLTVIGSASLWRSYRTTMRLYTGQFSSGKRRRVVETPAVAAAPAQAVPAKHLLERELPWISEQASVVALGSFRSLIRAPEAKMVLLSPIIIVLVFGSLFFTRSMAPPEISRPLLAFGAMTMILLSLVGLLGNQFGFDRGGFRVFVLSAAPRRDILLGKNLAVAPLALGLGLVIVTVLEICFPMRPDHFVAALLQLAAMYLLFCILANWLSIFLPMPIRMGSFKPVNPKGLPMLLYMVFTLLFPLVLVPVLLPLGMEFALAELGWLHGVPVDLFLSLAECAGVAGLYRLVLTWQGDTLQARELKILEAVTAKAE